MKRNLKYVKLSVACIILAVCTILGMILPNMLFSARDEQRMKGYGLYKTKPIVVTYTSPIPFDTKLKLMYGTMDGIRIVPVASDREECVEMRKVAKRELKGLNKAGALPKGLKFLRNESIQLSAMYKYFVIDTQEPEMRMYIWKVIVSGKKGNDRAGVLELAIEKESGKVVFMDAYSHNQENWKKMRTGFASYLSLESDAYETYLNELKEEMFVGGVNEKFVDEKIFGYASGFGACTADSSRFAYCFSSPYNNAEVFDNSSSSVHY